MAHQIEVSPEEVEAADASGNVDAIVRSVLPAKRGAREADLPQVEDTAAVGGRIASDRPAAPAGDHVDLKGNDATSVHSSDQGRSEGPSLVYARRDLGVDRL